MSNVDPVTVDPVTELWHRAQIQDAVLRYCRGVDRKDFDLMRSAYHDDAYDDHGAYKGDIPGLIEWVRARHARVDQSQHMITNCLVEINGDVAAVESYGIIYQIVAADRPEAQPTRLIMTVRYVDRFELRHDAWRIAHRVSILETLRSENVDAPLPPGGVAQQRGPEDALWAVRASAGFPAPEPS